jgi:hypothetical protein
MNSERRVTLVAGYEPAFGEPPSDVVKAGLTATVAVVLATLRSDSPDAVRDHALWLACMRAVSDVVAADEADVWGDKRASLVNRLLGRRIGESLGTLPKYAVRLSGEADAPDWTLIRWTRDVALVAAALCEPWDRVGGPGPYHDSYTTCVFVAPSVSSALAERIRFRVEEEGGHVDKVVDLGRRGTA